MPNKKNNRHLKLDWAIYLHELENGILGGLHSHSHEARELQASMDSIEFQALLQNSQHLHWSKREQAAKKLAEINHADACKALIKLLKDESQIVVMAAMNGLIKMRRTAVRPLLEEMTRDFQSTCFLKAARHILDELHKHGELTNEEIFVLSSLTKGKQGLDVAQIANQALMSAALSPG